MARTTLLAMYALLIVALCGLHPIAHAKGNARLLRAPMQLALGAETLTIDANAYLNLMPRVLPEPGQKIDCAAEGPFIVTIRFNLPALPPNTAIKRVLAHSNGRWWAGRIPPDDVRLEENRVTAVARGCPAFVRPGATVDVIVELRHNGVTRHLRSRPQKIGAVH